MTLSNTHIIPEIYLLKVLKDEADFQRDSLHNNQYAQGIEFCIEKIKEILDIE